jgi:CRP/FNR family transcriptional regulator, cyclic AMP receptor protein
LTALVDEATRERVAEAFRAVPLLSRLTERQREALARKATTRRYGAGKIVVRQGDTSMALYVVLSGSVRIERENESGTRTRLADSVGRHGFFGEMGLIEDEPRSATVTAFEDTECALLAKWDFQNELRSDPDIALALLPVLNARIRDLTARLARVEAGAA